MYFERLISKTQIKIFLTSLIAGVLLTSALKAYSMGVVEDISQKVVRLHVLANSDSSEDQELKIKVRDEVTQYLKPLLDDAQSAEESRLIIWNNVENIEEVAQKCIKKYGYTYSVTVNCGKYDFPTREYGNTRFPKGEYEAVKIIIGNGMGQNWWCMLYPQLCFDLCADGLISHSSDAQLKNLLTKSQYKMITSDDITFTFRIVEWFSD